MYDFLEIQKVDEEIARAILEEIARQNQNIELIASENFVSKAVMSALGSPLTNKYAEGYPKKRYYGGCDKVDISENLAISRAKKLFDADHVNVQPHSGAQANTAVFFALLDPGDTVLAMDLSHGGHLTHGSHINISGKYFNFVHYGVDEKTSLIDYDVVLDLATKHKPKMILAGASSYPRHIDFEKFAQIAKKVDAYLFVDMAHIAGLVASGYHQSPVPFADVVTTTTHKTLRGPRGGLILCKSEFASKIDKAVFPGIQGGPLMHTIASKAVSFKEALSDDFKKYSHQVILNAKTLSNRLLEKGFDIVSGGTDNHMVLVDLRNINITGKQAEIQLDSVNITCNKNVIPFDPESPLVTSGIRLGTPAMTTRGFMESDMMEVADLISLLLKDYDSNKHLVFDRVQTLIEKFPLDV